MAIEDDLQANTAAVIANTAAMNKVAALLAKGGGVAAEPEAAGATKPRGRPPGKKAPTIEEVKAIAERVRDERSGPEAIALIKKHGANKLADMDASKYAAFIAACEVALAGDGEEEQQEANEEL